MKTEDPQQPDLENENEPVAPRINDEQTNKRIHEHLANQDDIITPEDISNAITHIPPVEEDENTQAPEEEHKDEKEEDEELIEKKHTKGNSDPEIDTTWNILSE